MATPTPTIVWPWGFEQGPPAPEYIFVDAFCNELKKAFTASDQTKPDEIRAALATIPGATFLRELKKQDKNLVQDALDREDVGDMMSLLEDFLFGPGNPGFQVLTSRTATPDSESSQESLRGGAREIKITSKHMGGAPVQQIGGPFKMGMMNFPSSIRGTLVALIMAAGGLHKDGQIKTQVFHIIFMFVCLVFKTVYIDRTTKTRIAYLLYLIDSSWSLEKLKTIVGNAFSNRRAGRHVGIMKINKDEAEEMQCTAFLADLQQSSIKLVVTADAERLLPLGFRGIQTLLTNVEGTSDEKSEDGKTGGKSTCPAPKPPAAPTMAKGPTMAKTRVETASQVLSSAQTDKNSIDMLPGVSASVAVDIDPASADKNATKRANPSQEINGADTDKEDAADEDNGLFPEPPAKVSSPCLCMRCPVPRAYACE
jgi:hypothetical protein